MLGKFVCVEIQASLNFEMPTDLTHCFSGYIENTKRSLLGTFQADAEELEGLAL